MVDPLVFLTPILLLALVALLRFAGCSFQLPTGGPDEPTFEPPPGRFAVVQQVKLSATTPGATILFTRDGTDPTNPPTGTTLPFVAPIPVSTPDHNPITIKAIVVDPNTSLNSDVATGIYIIGNIGFQQQTDNDAETTTSASTTTAPFPFDVREGDLIVVWIWYNAAPTVQNVLDTAGDTYQRAVGPTAGAGQLAGWQQEIWYAKNVKGGPAFTVTVTFSAGTPTAVEKAVVAHQYLNANLDDPLEVVAAAIGATADATSGFATTTFAGLIFGGAIFSGSAGAGTGFAQRSNLRSNVTEDKKVATGGPNAATFTNDPQDWIAQMAAFK
jgi:hypothetical protein